MFKIVKDVSEIKELLKSILGFFEEAKENSENMADQRFDELNLQDILYFTIGQHCKIVSDGDVFDDFVVNSGVIVSFREDDKALVTQETKAYVVSKDEIKFVFNINESEVFEINGNSVL